MEIKKYDENFFIIDDGRVREFLITGESSALLIDTGFPDDNIKEEVIKITDKPIKLILTHSHKDHTGGISDFNNCFIHENETEYIKHENIKILKEGDIISESIYSFEVIHIPGHTKGSIALLDRDKKLLLSGDSVQTGPIFMFDEQSNIDDYIKSIKKLKDKYYEQIDTILPSHNGYPLKREYIDHCIKDAEELKAGRLSGKKHEFLPCGYYKGEHVSFFYNKKTGV